GGRVVIGMFKLGGYPQGFKGNFDNPANPYMLFNIGMASNYSNQGAQTIGTVPEPGSPLMANVVAPTSTGWTTAQPPLNGAVITANWNGGRPFIVRGVAKGRKRCDLNLWPDPTQWGGDTIYAIRNCLLYQ